MKKLLLTAMFLAFLFSVSQADGFREKASYAGPVLGFGWHDLMLGAQYEYGLSRYVGLGAIGGISWESYSDYWGEYGYTYIAIGCQCNYHFAQAKGWDPFLGGVLGYDIVSFHESPYAGYTHPHGWSHSASEMFLGGTAGANFKVGKTTFLQARLGYPFYLSGSLLFRF
jgi:hypothetical protein